MADEVFTIEPMHFVAEGHQVPDCLVVQLIGRSSSVATDLDKEWRALLKRDLGALKALKLVALYVDLDEVWRWCASEFDVKSALSHPLAVDRTLDVVLGECGPVHVRIARVVDWRNYLSPTRFG